MPRGIMVKLLRKAGAFTSGQLLPGEAGIDVTNRRLAFSPDGSSVVVTTPGGRQLYVWNGSAYVAREVPGREFVGPTDPATVGFTLETNVDAWDNTSPVATPNPTLINLLASSVQNATQTFADSGLSFPVQGGKSYDFKFYAHFTSSIATSGASGSKWTINGPANPTFLTYQAKWSTTQQSQSLWNDDDYNVGTPGNNNSQTTGNTAIIEGTITPSVDGVVMLRFAANVASQTITILGGSAKSRVYYQELP